jgi:DNA primase
MRSFRLGFAQDEWQGIYNHLKNTGYKDVEMEKAGLIKKGDSGRYYDRFRSRIQFPIMDASGRVVAFSGRIFGEPAKDEKNAKYLNSPETVLFDKSRILYGYNKAKQFIRKYDFSILVEGQMDLVLSHQAGYANTVAVSGTGLTNDHLLLLDRLSKKIVLAFDADTAGISSSGRAASLALKRGMDVKVAKVPKGKDPADCILEDVDAWKNAIKNANHVVDFYIDIVLEQSKKEEWDTRKLVLHARDTVFPYIAAVTSATDQAQFVRNISNILGIAEEAVWTDVQLVKKQTLSNNPSQTFERSATKNPQETRKSFSRKEDIEKTIAGLLFWQESLDVKDIDQEILKNVSTELMVSLEEVVTKYSNEKDTLIFQAEVMHASTSNLTEIIQSLIRELSKIIVTETLSKLAQRQREAERSNNQKEIEVLEKEVHKLSELKNLLSNTD